MAIIKKIKHKDKEGIVREYDIGVDAGNVTQDAAHSFVTDEEKTEWNKTDISEKIVTFTEKDNYDIGTGESMGTLLGKLKKLVATVKNILLKTDKFTATEAGYLSGVTSKIQTQIDGKAPKSHATSATTYGVATSSYYGHAKASTTTPKAPGATASVGSETAAFARGDHVHPLQTDISGNANTATMLSIPRYIDGHEFDGSADFTHYGMCTTSGSVAEKTVDGFVGFSLVKGAEVTVQFTYTNTASNPSLNVNGTGARNIYYHGRAVPANYICAYSKIRMVYDGAYWSIVGDLTQYQVDEIRQKTDKFTATEAGYLSGVKSKIQTQLDALSEALNLLKTPTVLSTATMYASALKTWKYTTVTGLSSWKEVRIWVEVGDASREFHTFTRNNNTVAVCGYATASYNGVMQVMCDFANNRVGVYVTSMVGWAYTNLRVLRVEGLVKN